MTLSRPTWCRLCNFEIALHVWKSEVLEASILDGVTNHDMVPTR